MKIDKNISQILDLSSKEIRIIELLKEVPMLASEISVRTKIPRATLDRLLLKLHKRNLIGKHKHSHRRGGWVSVPFLDKFVKEESTEKAFIIKNFVGLEAMKGAEYEFMARYKNTKCHGIQSTRAWKAWHTKLSKETAAELNSLLVTKNILMDVIITKSVDTALLKAAYNGRPSLARTLPEEFLPTAFDIEVTNREVFIMNWEKLKGVSIQDEELALMFKKIIEFIKEGSEYYNIHKALEK
jgi:hypothetical protein